MSTETVLYINHNVLEIKDQHYTMNNEQIWVTSPLAQQ